MNLSYDLDRNGVRRIRLPDGLSQATYFDNSEPISPVFGEWYLEFSTDWDDGESGLLIDAAFVQYVGGGRVLAEGDDCDREPHALVLILQSPRKELIA